MGRGHATLLLSLPLDLVRINRVRGASCNPFFRQSDAAVQHFAWIQPRGLADSRLRPVFRRPVAGSVLPASRQTCAASADEGFSFGVYYPFSRDRRTCRGIFPEKETTSLGALFHARFRRDVFRPELSILWKRPYRVAGDEAAEPMGPGFQLGPRQHAEGR